MRLLLLAGICSLLCAPGTASTQTYDETAAHDIQCPGAFNTYFRGDYQPVDYWGKQWLSQWFASSPERPLPSRTWYYAYPDRDIISTDNTAIWRWAEIKVHCWVYRSLYVTVIHYDPIDFGGYASLIPSDPEGGCGGGEYMTSVSPVGPVADADPTDGMSSEYYDPYDPDCSGGGGGSGGTGDDEESGGDAGGDLTFPELCSLLGGKLYYDYVCLEQWNARTGEYETVWCGTAAICET
ncbi:MAG TPA: hypothetical protein VF006_19665 [Longimicrobium sp.]